MEDISSLKVFILITIFSSLICAFLLNKVIVGYKHREEQLNKIINKQSEELFHLRIYKSKKEITNKIMYKLKNAAN